MGGGLIQHGGGGCREPVLVMVGTRVVHSFAINSQNFGIKKICVQTDKKSWLPLLLLLFPVPPFLHKQEGFFFKKKKISSSFATIKISWLLPCKGACKNPFSCKLLSCARFVCLLLKKSKNRLPGSQNLICVFFLPLDLCQSVLSNPAIVAGYMHPVLCLALYIYRLRNYLVIKYPAQTNLKP